MCFGFFNLKVLNLSIIADYRKLIYSEINSYAMLLN